MLFHEAAPRQTGVTMRTPWTAGRLEECAQALKRQHTIQCQKGPVAFRKYQAPQSVMTSTSPEAMKKKQKVESCLAWKNLSMPQMIHKRAEPEGIHPTEDGARAAVVRVDGGQQKFRKGIGTARTLSPLQVSHLLGTDADICFGPALIAQ